MPGRIVGCDVGGTFTDLILLDEAGGVRIAKVPTTVENQAFGVLAAIAAAEAAPDSLDAIVHGTTTTTNALLERKLARTGLIATQGFRDVLEIGRRTRPMAYGLTGHFEPLVPRDLRLEVPERMDAEGNAVVPLDEAALRVAVRRLLDRGVESLVVHFLHSYVNPAHERRAADIARELWPNDHITMGHAILSEYREYERGVTAAVNAAVRPVLDRYMRRLQDELQAKGFRHDLLVMQGNGGIVSSRIVAETAVNTVMSGPASGVIAAAVTGTAAGMANLVTYDMGGTSCDVGLILDGVPAVSGELEIEYAMPVHVPMVDVHTIGAGGGSIAAIDEAGMLRVGPESAGATPGPICYGRGGTRPTVTDANLVLGRLNPAALLAVDSPVSLETVRDAILEQVGRPLGLDADDAAAAILRIADDRMAGAIRMVSLSRGHDPRDFALFAFGGAGPLHAAALARELAIPRVLVPARPGITNALGCAVADVRHDYVNTINRPLASLDMALVRDTLRAQAAEGEATVAREGVQVDGIRHLYSADMQFQGQSHLLTVAIPDPAVTRDDLQAAFERAYWDRFEVALPDIRATLVNLHTAVIGRRPPVDLSALIPAEGRAADLAGARTGMRRVWFAEGGWQETPVYRRERLPLDAVLSGPAILEQLDTTTVLPPGARAAQDAAGNLILTVEPVA
ncbi:MAG: hydantoinase/oxoprolinase family protein [Alphaproteobacteria bacterium]